MEAETINNGKTGSAPKPFPCTICSKSYAKKSLRDHHIKTSHDHHPDPENENPRFKCDVCFKTFSRPSHLKTHQSRAHSHNREKTFKCEICSKNFWTRRLLRTHLFNVHKQKFEGISYFKCEFCSQEFIGRYKLEHHVVNAHVVDKAFKCIVCSRAFIDEVTLKRHMKRHDSEMNCFCDVCSKGYKFKHSLVSHLRKIHNRHFYCDKCLRSFSSQTEFDQHGDFQLKIEFKCQICNKILNSQCLFDTHTNSHLVEITTTTTEARTKPSSTKINTSKTKVEPGFSNTKKELPKTETAADKLNSEYLCELCSENFECEAYFAAHRKLMHPKAVRKCNFENCSKTFDKYSLLVLHKSKHSEDRPFVCTICQHSFHFRKELTEHERTHVDLKIHKFKCAICPNKSFSTMHQLKHHVAHIHEGPKPFKCPVPNCGTSWVSSHRLKRHLTTHQTDKIFHCQICTPSKSFKALRYLREHDRRAHSASDISKN